jgi:glycine/D-amino acid oxidase-like deaminating enzyme
MQEKKNTSKPESRSGISRRKFFSNAAYMSAGGLAITGLSSAIDRFGYYHDRPPGLYEFYVDNYWFKTAGFFKKKPNPPLKNRVKADIVIIGGGFTGLSSALHLIEKFPNKRIVLLEGARCGYGASGRNGGFVEELALFGYEDMEDTKVLQRELKVSRYGIENIRRLVSDQHVDCDFVENGGLLMAFTEKQAEELENYMTQLRTLGIRGGEMYQGNDIKKVVNSPRCIACLKRPIGGLVNPAKLIVGMKRLAEAAGVKIYEQTVVHKIRTGKKHEVITELGHVIAPNIVLGLHGYSPKLGLFKNQSFPFIGHMIATEPLSMKQKEAIGWTNRTGLSDMRVNFNFCHMTADGRIVMGGSEYRVYNNDDPSSGNNRDVVELLKKDLKKTFPQLADIKIDYAWSGTLAIAFDMTPSVGVMGDDRNIYYGVAFNEGVPTCQLAGKVISDLMAGESNIYTSHYIINHKIPWAGPEKFRAMGFNFYEWYLKKFVGVLTYR